MNSIVLNNYTSGYTPYGMVSDPKPEISPNAGARTSDSNTTATQASASAINITLSHAAQTALANEAKAASPTAGETALNKLAELLARFDKGSLLDGDTLAVDLSSLSRQEIFAVANNTGNLFSSEEQKAAGIEMERRFDAALKGGHALMRITGDYRDLYKNALEYLEEAGNSEKNTTDWQAHVHTIKQVLTYLADNPGYPPKEMANDPVADYLEREASGEGAGNDRLDLVADEARAVLDGIQASKGRIEGLSEFGSRTLSAIAANISNQFSSSEIVAAKFEMKSRVGASVQNAFQQASSSGDPTEFSKRLIAQYSAMSAEERDAAGLDSGYYDAIVKNYETSLRISQALNGGISGTATPANNGPSLLNFL